MPDLTKRGFKKPLQNDAYDIKVTNFNTDKLEEELDKKADLVDGKIKSNQLPEMNYAVKDHTHNDKLSTNGNGSNVTVDFSPIGYTDDIISGDKLAVIIGKIVDKFLGIGFSIEDIYNALSYKAPLVHNHTKANISDFPSSMPAADVYSWAKATTKPTYTAAEVGAATSSHTHTIANVTNLQSTLDSKAVIVMSTSAPSTTLAANVLHCVYQ